MKKNEYVAPEMEIVEITEQCHVLVQSTGGSTPEGGIFDGTVNPDDM